SWPKHDDRDPGLGPGHGRRGGVADRHTQCRCSRVQGATGNGSAGRRHQGHEEYQAFTFMSPTGDSSPAARRLTLVLELDRRTAEAFALELRARAKRAGLTVEVTRVLPGEAAAPVMNASEASSGP